MSPGLEDDFLVLHERLIHIYRESVEMPKGGHRTQLTVRKQVLELLLGRESHMTGGKHNPHAVEIHIPARRQHHHNELLIHLHNYNLGHLLFRSVKYLSDGQGMKRFRVPQYVIMHVFMIKIGLKYA